MTTYYVDGAVGNDINAGTSEGAGNAWETIGHAATQVTSGDIVYVKAGAAYAEDVSFTVPGTSASPITWIGYATTPGDNGQVVVTGAGVTHIFSSTWSSSFYNTWMNFDLSNGPSWGFIAATGSGASFLAFINCRFSNNGSGGVFAGPNSLWLNCESYGNGSTGIQGNSARIVGCKVQNNAANGHAGSCIVSYRNVLAQNGIGATNYQLIGVNGTSVFGCTIDGEGSSAAADGVYGTLSQALIMDNIIVNCDSGIERGTQHSANPSVNNLFHNNLIDLSTTSALPYDNLNDVSGDPNFADRVGFDYAIDAGSPAVDTGIRPGCFEA